MGSVCFIVDAMVTGSMLPRHLKSICDSGIADHWLPILVTSTQAHARLSSIEQRYHTHCLITPTLSLGARLNKAAFASQAEWLIIALQKQPLPASLWGSLYPQLNTYSLDALIVGLAQPSLSKRILRRLLASTLLLPPYIAVRRAWLQRLHDCPTRLKTYSGRLLSQADEHPSAMLPNARNLAYTSQR